LTDGPGAESGRVIIVARKPLLHVGRLYEFQSGESLVGEELRKFGAADPGLNATVAIHVREDGKTSVTMDLADELQQRLI
jgi:hypothetical protein